jgi:hypothetical protein
MDSIKPSMSYKRGNVKTWQTKLRKKLRQIIDTPPAKRVPLNVRSLWKRRHEYGTIEKIVFTSEPYADVPAYVCIPKAVDPPYTWMVCVQGHSTGMHNSINVLRADERKKIRAPGDRDFGITSMKNGLAALCIEQRSFGYRREQVIVKRAEHMCHDATMHALALGRTLMGERVWDVDRAIDYLYTRKDVRRNRIGVMGNSGGGTITVFSSALLPRISFAMPSCYFCTFRDSIMSVYHCMDNYLPGIIRYAEMYDIMGLFAPKPVVIVAGKTDPLFPISGVRRSFKQLKRIYKAAGAEDRCHLVVGGGGHRFYANRAWPVVVKAIGA